MKGFNDEFSSRPNDPNHVIIATSSGMLNCDKSCPVFQDEKFCSHVISIAIKYKPLGSYLAFLSKVNDIYHSNKN